MDGILNIHKPAGMTSFDVVAKIRRLTATKKVGHAGTLDPDATGVLPVCTGRATKVIEYLMEKDKAYRAVMLLGESTDTQDATGVRLKEMDAEAGDEEILKVMAGFVGTRQQLPPMHSAVRINGKRLYELARKGEEVERTPRPVTFYSLIPEGIHRFETEGGKRAEVTFLVECSKGTYIRTLCHDMGEALGCGGHMKTLVRTRSGPFRLEEAVTLEGLEKAKEEGTLESLFLSMDKALGHMPAFHVDANEEKRLSNGMVIITESPNSSLESGEPELVRLYSQEERFLGIGKKWIKERERAAVKAAKWIG